MAPGQQLVPHPPPGAIVAEKYRVERVLGQGGMGVVLAAKHTVLDQRFALKFVLDLSDQEGIERFLREARATAKLETEHVCRVSDVGTHEGAPFIVMEMLSGMDLHARLTAYGPMPPTEAVDYVLQALDALSEAHARGIVHRDLKPSNLFLANRGDGTTIVKVLDFGISKVHDVETITSKPAAANASKAIAASLTQTGTVMGSPPYMSPEQLASTRDVDARCDIWAIGTILYELLTGVRAFPGGAPELFQNILEGQHRPIRALRPEVPESLEAIIEKCLALRREERWSSAAELSRALLMFAPSKGKLHVARAERWAGGVSTPPVAPTPRGAASTAPTGGIALATTKRVFAAAPSRWSIISTVALGAIAVALFFIASRLRHAPAAAPPPPPSNVVAAEPPLSAPTIAPEPALAPSAAPPPKETKDAGAPHKKPRRPKPGEPVDLGRL